MSSPSLPSLASLQSATRPRGFVTARSVLVDLEAQCFQDGEPSEAIAAPSKPKRGRPTKTPNTDHAPSTNTTADDCHVAKAPAKVRTPKTQPATTKGQKGVIDAPPKSTRGRPKKDVTAHDEATTDIAETAKPTAKRGRKKAAESVSRLAGQTKPPPKPRKTKTPPKSQPIVDAPSVAHVVQTETSAVRPDAPAEEPTDVLHLDLAPKRRRDWTPPAESTLPPSFQKSSANSPDPEPATTDLHVDENKASEVPAALDFANLLGGFGYQEDSPRPPPALSRNSSDGATTKRKRLDPVNVTAAGDAKKRKKKDVAPKEPKDSKPNPPKKPKAPKKKPITITALATAAYRPQAAAAAAAAATADDEQTKLISDFFPQPQQDPGALPAAGASVVTTTAVDKPAPKRKRTKKVQLNVPEVHVKLDSPEAAHENMKRQQWLFGSSSQLAAADSPTELHDLQQALKESEEMVSSQRMDISRPTSYAHVPSAPHGTSLSVGQAYRVLWMSAARDFEDSTFASGESSHNHEQGPASEVPKPPELDVSIVEPFSSHVVPKAIEPAEVLTISSSASKKEESPDSGYIDVDQFDDTSPRAVPVDEEPLSETVPAARVPRNATMASSTRDVIDLDTMAESGILPRRALGTRDPNTNITRQPVDLDIQKTVTSPKKHLAKTSKTCLDSPEKRPRGRPRKVIGDVVSARSSVTQAPVSSQIRLQDHSPILQPISPSGMRNKPSRTGLAPKSTSPARSRGRTRKSVSPSALPVSSQLHRLPSFSKASPQHAAIAEPSSDYLDIDAISDAEMVSHVPSPPRRLPASPPKAMLEFDKPPPPPLATTTVRCTAKQLQAEWPAIAPVLFPRITRTIRSTPPSRNHKTPTWHEKILLYDPIVLEDLTAWLNGQGLRIDIAVPRSKGKKKADDADEATDMAHEELQPWMVQKWCEEHSVCCLWKEGLRGGVRQKY